MRRFLLLLLCAALVVGGCSGDDVDADPGPQPTTDDPGPNDTSAGPTTVQGVLTIGDDCLTVALPEGPVALEMEGYSVGDDAGQPALVADDDGRVLAHSGDTLVVSGRADPATTDPCGSLFVVESLNSVIPAATG